MFILFHSSILTEAGNEVTGEPKKNVNFGFIVINLFVLVHE